MNDAILRQNIFARWIIVAGDNPNAAWSGRRFVPINSEGLPAGSVQVCNFPTQDDAADYARKAGLQVAS